MFDDFFIRALIAGIGIAVVTGPIGCFVVWRRLAYYGDTLAHSGLLGVTLGYVFGLNMSFAVFVISTMVAFLLLFLQKRTKLTGDALLGLLAHSSLAIGLVIIAVLTSIRIDLMGLLFGDILSDEASMLTGSIGMLPSASLSDVTGVYEPIHGSAPDIAGQGIVNPIAMILSVAMMFEYSLNNIKVSNLIKDAIENVLRSGIFTKDISNKKEFASTSEMGNAIIMEIKKHV